MCGHAFLKKQNGDKNETAVVVKKKLKVRIPSKFLKKRMAKGKTVVKKKLKVRVPSKLLKKAVKRKVKVDEALHQKKKKKPVVLKKKKPVVLKKKKIKVVVKDESPTKKSGGNSTLSAVKRLVGGVKRNVKVHPK